MSVFQQVPSRLLPLVGRTVASEQTAKRKDKIPCLYQESRTMFFELAKLEAAQ